MLALGGGAQGLFVSYLAAAGAGGGFDELVPDPKPQQVPVDVHIAARSGVVPAQADLLPGHAHHPVGGDPPRYPVRALTLMNTRRGRGLNRPGMSGDSICWEGWGHVRWFVEEVPAGAT